MSSKQRAILLLAVVLVACKPAAQAVPAAMIPAATDGASESGASPSIIDLLKKGMSYADLRGQLLASGWLPLRNPACWDRVGGWSALCNQLPEVDACHNEDQCDMGFAHADTDELLTISTQGRYERWNAPGEASSVKVLAWKRIPLPGAATSPPAACPAKDFEGFLRAYASDPGVRASFTAPLVKMAELQTDDEDGFYVAQEGYHPRPVYMLGKDYQGFNLAYKDGAFHHVDVRGELDPEPLAVKTEQVGQGSYLAHYAYGMSEGNSYRFEARNGCWYLEEDPDPPSP